MPVGLQPHRVLPLRAVCAERRRKLRQRPLRLSSQQQRRWIPITAVLRAKVTVVPTAAAAARARMRMRVASLPGVTTSRKTRAVEAATAASGLAVASGATSRPGSGHDRPQHQMQLQALQLWIHTGRRHSRCQSPPSHEPALRPRVGQLEQTDDPHPLAHR
jgi:hypothetical protein